MLLKTGQNTTIKGDAAVAMISVGSLAVGYLLMNVFSTSANLSGDVCTTLFGSVSILTLTEGEVWLSVGLSAGVVIVFTVFYNRIFAALSAMRVYSGLLNATVITSTALWVNQHPYFCSSTLLYAGI